MFWLLPPVPAVLPTTNPESPGGKWRLSAGLTSTATDRKFITGSGRIQQAQTFKLIPAVKKWLHNTFYTEEKSLEIRADWNGKSGIWASFIPYAGAQPVVVNVTRPEDDDDVNYQTYVDCMEGRGYTARNYNIPEVTNIYLRDPYQKSPPPTALSKPIIF